MHFGKMIQSVDMRGEVAILTRNIRIAGVMEDACLPENKNCDKFDTDTFGGHIKVGYGHSFNMKASGFSHLFHFFNKKICFDAFWPLTSCDVS